jgi:hypothetical protein
MTRASRDELDPATGRIWNGFDDRLQVWVRDGIVEPCGHPARIRASGPCCPQDAYAGRPILEIEGAEERRDPPEAEVDVEDPLVRIVERHGSIRQGELERLPDHLPVVMKLGSGHRASTTAGQAIRFIELLGDQVAEVYLPGDVCRVLRRRGELNTGNDLRRRE